MCDDPEHGQLFDNHKRWCANCDKTVTAHYLTCSECGAIWPEHVEDYLEEMQNDPDNQDYMGLGATWH